MTVRRMSCRRRICTSHVSAQSQGDARVGPPKYLFYQIEKVNKTDRLGVMSELTLPLTCH